MKGPKTKWVGGSRLSCYTKLSFNSKLTAPQHPMSPVSLHFSDKWITFTSSIRLTFFYSQEFIFPSKHRKVGLLHAIMKFAFSSDVFNTYHKSPLCQGSANFFCIEPNGRDFMLCKLWCLWHIQPCCYSMKSATDNISMNGCGCITITFYLQKQVMNQIWFRTRVCWPLL